MQILHIPKAKTMKESKITIYESENSVQLEVLTDQETVWLTQAQIAELFGVKVPAISKHLSNIYKSGELDESSTFSILENMGKELAMDMMMTVVKNEQ